MNRCFVILFVIFLLACQTAPTPFEQFLNAQPITEYDLLIYHGTLVDGTGQPAYLADVLVNADTIAFVGVVDTSLVKADRIINATGKVVTPGFIDMHAHGDPLTTPDFRNFLAMGVTTIVLGKDGSSPEYENLAEWMQRVEDTVPVAEACAAGVTVTADVYPYTASYTGIGIVFPNWAKPSQKLGAEVPRHGFHQVGSRRNLVIGKSSRSVSN